MLFKILSGLLIAASVVVTVPAHADQAQLNDLLRSSASLDRAGKLDDAVAEARRALAHAERLYGQSHPQVALVLDRLAALYRKQNDFAAATAAQERSRAIRRTRIGAAPGAPAGGSAAPPDPTGSGAPPVGARPRALALPEKAAPREPVASAPLPSVPRSIVAPPAAPVTRAPATAPAPAPSPRSVEGRPTPPRAAASADDAAAARPAPPAPTAATAATAVLDPKAFAEVPVYFGTNRAQGPTVLRNGVGLTSFTATPASALTLGKAVVSVPRQGRDKGEIPRPRSETFWRAKEAEDPRFHFMLLSVVPGSREVFIREVNERLLRSSGPFKDQAFVFVHGFNVPFEDAVYRTAQIAYDLDFTGVPFLYSWPTLEGAFGYVGARDRAMASRAFLRQFLDLVSKQTNAKRVHLVAHSMGTWPLLDVLREIAVSDVAEKKAPRFQEVVLAAPDMDRENFMALAQQICPEREAGSSRCAGGSAKGVTIYASNNDRALLASVRIASGIDRAGLFDEKRPFVVKHVDTIDVSAADTSFFSYNHSQPLERSQLLKDIGLLLQGGQRPPHQRYPDYESRKTTEGGEYWRFLQRP